MSDWLIVGLLVLGVLIVAAIAWYWVTRGRERRLERRRETAAEHRDEARERARQAGEVEFAARRQMEKAERQRETAVRLDRKATEVDPDSDTDQEADAGGSRFRGTGS
jgi:F0F1-type ATP synthase membrane subunit b/b'